MRLLILTILLIIANILNKADAKGLQFTLTQGFAHHYVSSIAYNDSVFSDNKTSTNTLVTIGYNNFSLTGLADSQGSLSFATTYSYSMTKRLSLLAGLYLLRDEKIKKYEPQSPVLLFPSFNIGDRSFLITPLLGVQYSVPLTDKLSFDTLVTPAFTLIGLSVKL